MNYFKDFLLLEAQRTKQNVLFLSTFFVSGMLVVILSSSFVVSMKKDIVEHENGLQEQVDFLEKQLEEKEAEVRELQSAQDRGERIQEAPPQEDQSEELADLQKKLDDQYQRIKRKEAENNDLREQLIACQNRPPAADKTCQDRIQSITVSKDRVITRLEQKLSDCEKRLSSTSEECKKALDDCRRQQRDCREEINKAIEETTAKKDREINKLRVALENCQGTDRYRPMYEDCEQSRKEMEREINSLQASLNKISQANRTAQQRLSCLEECLPSLRNRCKQCY